MKSSRDMGMQKNVRQKSQPWTSFDHLKRVYTCAHQNGVLGVQNQSGVQSGVQSDVQINLWASTRDKGSEAFQLGRETTTMMKCALERGTQGT